MIKVIIFDLIGVLVFEKSIELNDDEKKLERLFGPNISDKDFFSLAQKEIGKDKPIFDIAKNILFKLYYVKNNNVIESIKENYPYVKIIIATNHITFIKDFINNNFNTSLIDDVIVSADINMIKPNDDFYKYILKKHKLKSKEVLFLDDSLINVEGAIKVGFNAIKVDNGMDLVNEIEKIIK